MTRPEEVAATRGPHSRWLLGARRPVRRGGARSPLRPATIAMFGLLAGLPSLASARDFAPDPEPAAPPVSFRADFRTGWNLVDGAGVIDHIGLEGTVGPQFTAGAVGLAPLLAVAGGIAEDAQPSLRLLGGFEWSVPVARRIELVPALFGGYFEQWKGDQRKGPMIRLTLGVRLLSDEDFFLVFSPMSLVVLPPPPGGFTRYTSHVTLDAGVVHFGGRTR